MCKTIEKVVESIGKVKKSTLFGLKQPTNRASMINSSGSELSESSSGLYAGTLHTASVRMMLAQVVAGSSPEGGCDRCTSATRIQVCILWRRRRAHQLLRKAIEYWQDHQASIFQGDGFCRCVCDFFVGRRIGQRSCGWNISATTRSRLVSVKVNTTFTEGTCKVGPVIGLADDLAKRGEFLKKRFIVNAGGWAVRSGEVTTLGVESQIDEEDLPFASRHSNSTAPLQESLGRVLVTASTGNASRYTYCGVWQSHAKV